jgi:hypothetical protein
MKTRSCLGLKSTINIELENPKFISLHQEFTPILAPRLNVGTNIIDQIYTERYKNYLYYCLWAHNIPKHSQNSLIAN